MDLLSGPSSFTHTLRTFLSAHAAPGCLAGGRDPRAGWEETETETRRAIAQQEAELSQVQAQLRQLQVGSLPLTSHTLPSE
jgi:hypothetical protein